MYMYHPVIFCEIDFQECSNISDGQIPLSFETTPQSVSAVEYSILFLTVRHLPSIIYKIVKKNGEEAQISHN